MKDFKEQMTQSTIKLSIPFESLVETIASLELEDKLKLWQLLEDDIIQAEEELLEQDSTVKAEIYSARIAYQAGDYLTLDEYVAQKSEKL